MNNYLNDKLFDYGSFFQSKIFEDYTTPWEIISKLKTYIDEINGDQNILIGEGSKIDPSAKIEGKVIIGKNSTIGDNVLLRDGCIIGDNVHIGHAVEIKHSIIMNDTAVAHLNYVGDSIIGNNVNVGGGAIVANWRFDRKNIKVKVGDDVIDTQLEKFGACVGDHSSLGVNCVLNPGTILEKNVLIFPLVSVHGTHPEQSVIKG